VSLVPRVAATPGLVLLGLVLGSCSAEVDPWHLTRESIEQGLARARREAAPDPLRPGYHLVPLAGEMADPNAGIHHDGWYHLFYMHRPFEGSWYWGHVRSRDLVEWEHLPPTLTPPYERGAYVMFSGSSIVAPGGEPLLFYSAPMEEHVDQLRAVGNHDLTEWTHPDPNPVLTTRHPGVPRFESDWRDPFVFEVEGRYFLILYAERLDEDVVHLPIFEAEDEALTRWAYRGILFSDKKHRVRNLEVPDFRPLGDRWVLLVSSGAHVDRTSWYLGDFDLESLTFTPTHSGRLDHSSHFYAQETLPGPSPGELHVIGWIPGWDRDWMPDYREDRQKNTGTWWNGCFSLPRRLSIGVDGHLMQAPAGSLKALRGDPARWPAPRTLPVEGNLVHLEVVEELRGDQIEIVTELELGNAAFAGLNVLADDTGAGGLPIMWSGDRIQVDGISISLPEWQEGDPVALHIFVDHAYVEVFVNEGRHTVTRKVQAGSIAGDRVSFTRIGGAMTVRRFEGWPLRRLNPLP
jgi:beta-fructofuranosidase